MAAEQSDEAVAEALRGILRVPEEAEAAPQDTAEVEEVTEEVEAEPAAEATTAEAPEAQDDIVSLRQRLAEREVEAARYKEQLEAVQTRNRQSLEAVNARSMRFASQRDRARQLLEKAMSPDGVDKSEAERLLADIRGGYNAASANYEPPQYGQPTPTLTEDQTIATNEFFNERAFTQADVESFGEWARSKAVLTERERRLASVDMHSFLALIEPRWRADSAKVTQATQTANDNTRAVQTVSRVQKQAAKAAAASLGTQVSRSQTKPAGPVRLTDEQLAAAMQATWDDR